MAAVVRTRSFDVGWKLAPPHVRRSLLRVLTTMAEAPAPAPLPGDEGVTLWIPVAVPLVEHVVPNTGWSLLYVVTAEAFLLRFLCETPAR